jgi:hypothetical protein
MLHDRCPQHCASANTVCGLAESTTKDQRKGETIVRNRSLLFILLLVAASIPANAQSVKNFVVTNQGMTAYLINGASNPTLTVAVGQTYTFQVSAPNHPFLIKTARGTGAPDFNTGVTNNGVETGTLTFTVPPVPPNPSPLFYQCGVHNPMGGTIMIVANPVPATGSLAVALLAAMVLAAGFFALRRRVRGDR